MISLAMVEPPQKRVMEPATILSMPTPASNAQKPVAWVITSGAAGMQSQAKALAEGLGAEAQIFDCELKPFVSWMPNAVYDGLCRHVLRSRVFKKLMKSGAVVMQEPMPDYVISCGRRAVPCALALKERHHDNTLFIHIGDPYMDVQNFDAVIAMQHDKIAKKPATSLITTRYSLHNISNAVLDEAYTHFVGRFAEYTQPLIAVLIGGSTNKYELNLVRMKEIVTRLKSLLTQTQGTLLITVSRRTGVENSLLLKESFKQEPRVSIYDGEGENPYLGMLAHAQTIIVTNDSVNMMSEALATKKPVYVLGLPEHENTKPSLFAKQLIKEKIAKELPLRAPLESWEYKVPNEMQQVVDFILAKKKSERLQWDMLGN